ncbi:Multiple inositol polyphosphate phosphatase 1 [Schistosoma japonicum]|nr:Multiple inositol polyphosphate phosphatase 1 [Schistosoma japonicum]
MLDGLQKSEYHVKMFIISHTSSSKVDLWQMGGLFSAFFAVLTYLFCIFNRTPETFFSGLSSKTAYRFCGLKSYEDQVSDQFKRCSLVHVNALFRHGTRTPDSKSIKSFADLYKRLKKSYDSGSPIPNKFLTHPIPFEDAPVKELLPRGFEEHDGLGRRFSYLMRQYFNFTIENINFYSSSIDRCIASGRAFYNGVRNIFFLFNCLHYCDRLFGASHLIYSSISISIILLFTAKYLDVLEDGINLGFIDGPPVKPIWNRTLYCGDDDLPKYCLLDEPLGANNHNSYSKNITINNYLLRFFADCKKYIEKIEKNKSALQEYYKFFNSSYVTTSYENFIKRFHLKPEEYTPDDLKKIFFACSYEIAVMNDYDDVSPWCSLLTPNDFPIWEYLADLKHYWRKSYGYELNYKQSCPLLGEMLQQIYDVAINFKKGNYNQNNPLLHRGSFWFGHAETVLPIVAALGIFNDSVGHSTLHKLTADNFNERLRMIYDTDIPSTMFRTSYIAPFAGNVALLLYYCPDLVVDWIMKTFTSEGMQGFQWTSRI